MTKANLNAGASGLYDRLMSSRSDFDSADRHVLACILAIGAEETDRPLTEAVGLDRPTLLLLLDKVFPGACDPDDLVPADATAGEEEIEEPDFRTLLLDGRARGADIEVWLAHMVVRRALRPEHLWHSLGLRERSELSDMLYRHFPALAARNVRNMRWKKFFYREMCQAEGILVCKSPVCDICADYGECFLKEN